jgi:hypothetical protein
MRPWVQSLVLQKKINNKKNNKGIEEVNDSKCLEATEAEMKTP